MARGGGEAGRRREAERLAGGGEAGWRLGDGEAGRQRGAAADEQAGRGGRRGRTRRGRRVGQAGGRIMAADKSAAAQNPLPDANFSRSRARLGNISRALQLFPSLERFTPAGPRGNKFPRDFARVTLDYAVTCYYANDYAR